MTVFYRKYRPQKFSEITGQELIKKTLLGQLESGKISHGYLFCGPRGTGKTSTARIFAKAVNCEVFGKTVNRQVSTVNRFGEPCNKCLSCTSITAGTNLDLIEVDAASNRGIDEIRDLREKIKLSPVSARFKVYIIDEVHMLTNEAFNALLKTLEEPPAHVIFILCTTEPNKLPETIVSRLVRLNFSRAKVVDLALYLENIAGKEKIKIGKEAILAIAKEADGSFRDSASILDQLSASNEPILADLVRRVTKSSGLGQTVELIQLLFERDLKKAVEVLDRLEGSVDFGKLTVDMLTFLKELLLVKIGVGEVNDSQIKSLLTLGNTSDIKSLIRFILKAEGEMRLYPSAQIPLILAFCDFCGDESKNQNDSKVEDLEETKKETEDEKKNVDEPARLDENVIPDKKVEASSRYLGDLSEIEANWSKFLEKVKQINAHVVALLRSSKPVAFDGKIVAIEVFFSFHKDKLAEPKIMDILCGTMSEVMGKNVSFKLILAEGKTRLPKAVLDSDVSEVDPGELSIVAQEIFAK